MNILEQNIRNESPHIDLGNDLFDNSKSTYNKSKNKQEG